MPTRYSAFFYAAAFGALDYDPLKAWAAAAPGKAVDGGLGVADWCAARGRVVLESELVDVKVGCWLT